MFLSFRLRHYILDIFNCNRIDSGKGFIEKDEIWFERQCPGYFGTSSFTAGELDPFAFSVFSEVRIRSAVFQVFRAVPSFGNPDISRTAEQVIFDRQVPEH